LRSDLKNSLNFELPCDELDGTVTVDAQVWVNGDFVKKDHRLGIPASGWSAELTITHTFSPRRSLQVQPPGAARAGGGRQHSEPGGLHAEASLS
jgi:hypothetical protein